MKKFFFLAYLVRVFVTSILEVRLKQLRSLVSLPLVSKFKGMKQAEKYFFTASISSKLRCGRAFSAPFQYVIAQNITLMRLKFALLEFYHGCLSPMQECHIKCLSFIVENTLHPVSGYSGSNIGYVVLP